MTSIYWDDLENTIEVTQKTKSKSKTNGDNSDDENSGSNITDDEDNEGKSNQLSKNNKKKDPIDIFNYTPVSTIKENVILITKSGAFIKYSDISTSDGNEVSLVKAVRKIENYFTLKTKLITGHEKQSKRCVVDRKKRRIVVPRFGIYEILTNKFGLSNYTTKSQLKFGEVINYKLDKAVQMTHNQKIVIDYILQKIYTKQRVAIGSAGLVLNLEAGQGKSFVAAYLMSIIKRKTAIVLHSTSMIEQWAKVLRTCYPESSIGYYYGKKKIMGDIMLIVIDSACSDIFKFGSVKKQTYQEIQAIDFYNMFGFMIFDECHKYANKSDSKVFKSGQTPYMLGLSATPDENANKFDRIHTWEIGPVLSADRLPGYKETKTNFTAIVHKIMYYGSPEYTQALTHSINVNGETKEMADTIGTIGMISSEYARNRLIIKCILECMDKQLYTYVFADRREYLEQLRNLLKEFTNQNSDIVDCDADFIRLVGGSKTADLETAEIKSRIIFTTYQYGGTGRSIIKMNALIFATPRKSNMKQTVGRILRLGSDESIKRHIYDIVDMKLKLKSQWSERAKYYKSRSFEIEEEKYTHTWETDKETETVEEIAKIAEKEKTAECKKLLKKDYSKLSLSILAKLKE